MIRQRGFLLPFANFGAQPLPNKKVTVLVTRNAGGLPCKCYLKSLS